MSVNKADVSLGCLVQGISSMWEVLVLRHKELLTSDLELIVILITVCRKLGSHRSCSPCVHMLAVGSCAALIREIQSVDSLRVLGEEPKPQQWDPFLDGH